MWSSLRQIVFLDLDYNNYIWLLDDWLKSSSRNNFLCVAVLKLHFLAVIVTFPWLCWFLFSLFIIQRRRVTLSSQNTSLEALWYDLKVAVWELREEGCEQTEPVNCSGGGQKKLGFVYHPLFLVTFSSFVRNNAYFDCSGKFSKMRIQNSLNLLLQSQSKCQTDF